MEKLGASALMVGKDRVKELLFSYFFQNIPNFIESGYVGSLHTILVLHVTIMTVELGQWFTQVIPPIQTLGCPVKT